VNRRAEIATLKSTNPCLTLQQIGNKFGITRERVRQILVKERTSTRRPNYGQYSKICPMCKKSQIRGKTILCRSCYHHMHTVPLSCELCGTIVYRKQSEVIRDFAKANYQHIWCSKQCQGKWFGANFGWGRK